MKLLRGSRFTGIFNFINVIDSAVASCALLAVSISHADATSITPTTQCGKLAAQLSLPNTTIESVDLDYGALVDSTYPYAGPRPQNCVVKGVIGAYTSAYTNPDTGSNAYGTHFELRLPTQWNGRFFYQAGGGGDGFVVYPAGQIPSEGAMVGPQPQTPALWRGYAVVSADGGHNGGPDAATAYLAMGFGIDPTARINYGYASIGQVTPVAKQIISQYYSQRPAYSYILGCSKGGQEGMQAAERYANEFDGVVAGDPAFHIPQAEVGATWVTQTIAAVALDNNPTGLDANGNPLLYNAFSSSDLEVIRKGIADACDALDGLADGMVFNTKACAAKFNPSTLQCTGAKTSSCLTAVQVAAVQDIFNGAVSSTNTPLYASFPYDTGISSLTGWGLLYMGTSATSNTALNLQLGQEGGAYLLSSPPNPSFDMFTANIDQMAQAIRTASGAYPVSAVNYLNADSTNLTAFKNHGGKIIYYHGAADPIFSANDTVNYYQKLSSVYGSATQSFARLFLVPGMNHCTSGAYATDYFDTLTAIVNWVENGIAPDSIIAQSGTPLTTKLFPGTKRPLCPYPKYARYKGFGLIIDPANFTCENP